MRPFAIVAAALATLALGFSPLAAHAQEAGKISKEQRDKGMKEAPAAVQAAGVPCTITDAYYLGSSAQKDSAGKDVKSSIYEVACKEGFGYMVMSSPSGAKAYDCLATSESKNLACKLPANAHPEQALGALLSAGGHPCMIKAGRYVGVSSSGVTVYEAACEDGAGYVIQTHPGGTPEVASCLDELGSSLECKLTTRDAILAQMGQLVAKSGKSCAVSDARGMGSDVKTGEVFYEVACGSAPGFVIQTDKTGAFMAAIDCGKAQGIGGGCKLTDVSKVETADAANYSRLATAGGFNCNVSKYRFIGTTDQPGESSPSEIVELACSNRPDGVVAVFPGDTKAKPTFLDCVRAGEYGPTAMCKLTTPTSVYAKYTRELAAQGRSSCVVSDARYIGHTADGITFVETACADKNPGYVLQLSKTDALTGVMNCAQAAAAGAACKLPTNMVKH